MIVESTLSSKADPKAYRRAVEGVERLILAHACAGVDVQDSRYVEGILTALEALANAYCE